MDTERRRGRGREGAYFISVARPEKTIQIQRDEEQEEVPALYPQDGLKQRGMQIQRDEEDEEEKVPSLCS